MPPRISSLPPSSYSSPVLAPVEDKPTKAEQPSDAGGKLAESGKLSDHPIYRSRRPSSPLQLDIERKRKGLSKSSSPDALEAASGGASPHSEMRGKRRRLSQSPPTDTLEAATKTASPHSESENMLRELSTVSSSSPPNDLGGDFEEIELKPAKFSFDEDVPQEIRNIAPYVQAGLASAFPATHRQLHISVADNLEEEGNTQVIGNMAALVLRKLPNDIENRSARYALTLTHEMFIHALPNLKVAAADQGEFGDVDDEHETMFTPPDTTNGYLNAIRNVLQHLPDNELKSAYLKEYARDVDDHLKAAIRQYPADEDFSKEKSWVRDLKNACGDINHPMWNLRSDLSC